MRSPPPFFEPIRQQAAKRWDQLEADPDLAGPWRQLFRQVQSPRHVLSELLQNAEDAEAHSVRVRLDDDDFIFEHDGHDFLEEEFRSLCRFGFSNKRSLLTIGFRGVGFRSVFSLGDTVRVASPSLGVSFRHDRFTEPVWDADAAGEERTVIRCRVTSSEVLALIRSEIDRWGNSPTPLLFFDSICDLEFAGRRIAVEKLGAGPCAGSQRLRLPGCGSELLVIRSESEALPATCLAEVRAERGDQSIDLPPVEVTIVLGSEAQGRLHVVLPTDVVFPRVPVAIHGPFIQDPGRIGIKDPAISPTNTWLLERVGRLIAASLQSWVGDKRLGLGQRAAAYDLLPASDKIRAGLSGGAEDLVLRSFERTASAMALSLCTDGEARTGEDVAALPAPVLEVWPASQALVIAGADRPFALAREVSAELVDRLGGWGLAAVVPIACIMRQLDQAAKLPPRPARLEALVKLWAAFFDLTGRRTWEWAGFWRRAAVVPVRDGNHLGSAMQVLPAVATRPQQVAEEDWGWLLSRVGVADEGWATWADTKVAPSEVVLACQHAGVALLDDEVRAFRGAFEAAGLRRRPSDAEVVDAAARSLGADPRTTERDWIRLTRIAWRLEADLGKPKGGEPFRFLCRDGMSRSRTFGLLACAPPGDGAPCPQPWLQERVIADDYFNGVPPGDVPDWLRWLASTRGAQLLPAPMPRPESQSVWGSTKLEDLLVRAGGQAPGTYPYQREDFSLQGWDWEKALRENWLRVEAELPNVWTRAACPTLQAAIDQPDLLPPEALVLEAWQASGRGKSLPLEVGQPRAPWIELLRSKRCLPDEYGKGRLPAELLRRTPETEALVGMEPFIKPELDAPQIAAVLDALGVRSTPTGASSIVERLRSLSGTDCPIGPIRDLYRALDRVAIRLDSDHLAELRAAFREDRLVRTAGGWQQAAHAFRTNPSRLPGVDTLHPDVADLGHLWDRLGINSEPNSDDVVHWLGSLPLGTTMPDAQRRGVELALRRVGVRCWRDVNRWLNVAAQLSAAEELKWAVRDSRLVEGVFSSRKKEIADFSFLDSPEWQGLESIVSPLIDARLGSRIEGDASPENRAPQESAWLRALGEILQRLGSPPSQPDAPVQRDREQGRRLASSQWFTVPSLEVTPCLDGVPIGPRRSARVVWNEQRILAVDRSSGVFKDLVQELTRHFASEEARSTIRDCAGRDPDWIAAYAERHLRLGEPLLPGEEEPPTPPEPWPPPQPPVSPPGAVVAPPGPGPEPRPGPHVVRKDPRHETRRERFETYLLACGFEKDEGMQVFRRGRVSVRTTSDDMFPWEWVEAGGVRPIWISDSRLDSARGIELPAEVWSVGVSRNAMLFEPNDDAGYDQHDFSRLDNGVSSQQLGLFLATYRLRRISSAVSPAPAEDS